MHHIFLITALILSNSYNQQVKEESINPQKKLEQELSLIEQQNQDISLKALSDKFNPPKPKKRPQKQPQDQTDKTPSPQEIPSIINQSGEIDIDALINLEQKNQEQEQVTLFPIEETLQSDETSDIDNQAPSKEQILDQLINNQEEEAINAQIIENKDKQLIQQQQFEQVSQEQNKETQEKILKQQEEDITQEIQKEQQKEQLAKKQEIKVEKQQLEQKINKQIKQELTTKTNPVISTKPQLIDSLKQLLSKNQEENQVQDQVKPNPLTIKQLQDKQKSAEQKEYEDKLEELKDQYLINKNDLKKAPIDLSRIKLVEKKPPKFQEIGVPRQLLNRNQTLENYHLPMHISKREKVEFIFDAIAKGNIDNFEALYTLINEPNLKNNFGDTLLTFAAIKGRKNILTSLLAKGADSNMPNNLGYRPLNIAIEIFDINSVKTLVDYGTDLNIPDPLGRTYLMQASRIGAIEIVEILVENGANINFTNKNGNNALNIAQQYKWEIIVTYLEAKGADQWQSRKEQIIKKPKDSIINQINNQKNLNY